MRIINSLPFMTSGITWQEQLDQWSLTIVCKATFLLEQGTALLAAEPDGMNEQDNHWDDDPQKSVYAPSDMVPYKPHPEVLLVGSAYAPRKEPVRSLFARMIVGQLDKSIEVFSNRTITPEGTIVDGPRWTQMSLRYERAAGGGDSWNPVGVDASHVDAYGRRQLPNLQPPAFTHLEGGQAIPATGFGPMAASWSIRQEKLGASSGVFAEGRWTETPLRMDFDGLFFQSAPADQFVEEIRADETIILENLHPDIERLVTRLPGIKPRTRVEIDGLPPWELALVADTLWIDTNRSTCTVTFRGQLPLDGRDQPGTIFIGVEYPGEPVRFPHAPSKSVSPIFVKSEKSDGDLDDLELTHTNADALEGDRATSLPGAPAPALPWDPGAKPPAPVPPPPPLPPKIPEEFGETSVFAAPANAGRMPTWLGGGSKEAAPIAGSAPMQTLPARAMSPNAPQTPRPPPVAPPPPVTQLLQANEAPPTSLTTASQRATGQENVLMPRQTPPGEQFMGRPGAAGLSSVGMAPPGSALMPPPPPRAPAPTLLGIVPSGSAPGTTVGQAAVLAAAKASSSAVKTQDKEKPPAGRADSISIASAAFLGAAEASNAAATSSPGEKEDKPLPTDRPSAGVSQSSAGRTIIDLLWFEPGLPSRLEENESWKRILQVEAPPEESPKLDEDGFVELDLGRPQRRPAPPPREKRADERAKEDKSRVSRVISRANATVDVEQVLYSAINDDGVLEAPLCLVSGDLELPFDEIETLKVLTSAAAPLATGDKKLKETIDLANEALGTSLGQSPEVAANFSLRIREAWTKANRFLAADYLDVHSRRVLLEQRKYQMRELDGAQWIRGLMHGVLGEKGIPTYLPAELLKKLPLFMKLGVRMVVEVLPQQDQTEHIGISLRVHALARMISPRPRR